MCEDSTCLHEKKSIITLHSNAINTMIMSYITYGPAHMNDTTKVFCQYFQENKTVLTRAPLPGELGKRIQQNISKEAWQLWLVEQTKLINEYRLDPTEQDAISQLAAACEAFLFKNSESPHTE